MNRSPQRKSVNSGKPVDLWLGALAAAVAILLWLLPKTPTTIILSLMIIFILFVHPVLNFGWIEKRRWRQVTACTSLVAILALVGFISWPSETIRGHIEKVNITTYRTDPKAISALVFLGIVNSGNIPTSLSAWKGKLILEDQLIEGEIVSFPESKDFEYPNGEKVTYFNKQIWTEKPEEAIPAGHTKLGILPLRFSGVTALAADRLKLQKGKIIVSFQDSDWKEHSITTELSTVSGSPTIRIPGLDR